MKTKKVSRFTAGDAGDHSLTPHAATDSGEFSRRDFLKTTGALIVGVGAGVTTMMEGSLADAAQAASDPQWGQVDSWLAIARDGTVTLFTGKIEIGTGSSTGRMQIAAEELDVPFDRMRLVQGITGTTPDQYVSSASNGILEGGPPIRQAAAGARHVVGPRPRKRNPRSRPQTRHPSSPECV